MPQEITKHNDVLAAIEKIGAISDLTAKSNGHYDYELDLEVIVYGRNYSGKRVGPYVRLLNYGPGEVIVSEGDWGGNSFYIVVSGTAEVYVGSGGKASKVTEIPEGVQFGEMSVLAGVPRAATVCAPADAEVQVLEIQRPALRLLRKLPRFGEVLDRTYRRNGRSSVIQSIKAATQLSEGAISQLEAISKFSIYSKNHVLFRAGEPIRNLYIIRSGWARLAPADFHPPESPAQDWNRISEEVYIGPSHCLGAEAITRDSNWDATCMLLGRAELLEISVSKLRQYPELRETLLLAFSDLVSPRDAAHNRQPLPVARAQGDLIETGLVDATNLLVMDMDLCVRCGNCSLACHKIHGQSRLLRRGIHIERPVSMRKNSGFQSLLAPSVCLHCKDPECLTGCPTGAIGRFSGGQVDIDPKTCIGCADCATQCPYNAISMAPRQAGAIEAKSSRTQRWFGLSPEPLPPAVDQTEDLLAVKCNLCAGTPLNQGDPQRPAYSCEENCPTGSLLRVDPRVYFSEIRNIEGVIFRDGTQAIVRHTSHRDAGKGTVHFLGLAATLVLTALTVWGLFDYGLEKPLIGAWLDLRWLTGIAGLIGIAGVMTYPVRKQIYRRRAGPLRYWMLAHSYLGVIAGILLLLHGGTSSGGVLTTALMISFDLVILTGLFGILVYLIAPRIMTRIEGQPLLIEDLTARREELSRRLGEEMAAATPNARMFVQKRLIPRIWSLWFLFRQYLKHESLDGMIENLKSAHAPRIADLPEKDRGQILEAIETAATLRRVDALIYLHQSLKLWLAPHVLFTSLMLALMIVHIIQVIFFADFG
ncbi:MAG: cyclic nucleotide-binding domain-containing protein [Acidobacteriota bacterium]|nr:MAG: cyclic nucleotide-binding domain-containing protein [Acidobacteriota bacterium]